MQEVVSFWRSRRRKEGEDMDKKKLLYSILKEIKQGNEPNAKDYGLTIEEFGSVVEMAKDEGYIKNAGISRGGRGNPILVVFLKGSTITKPGLDYLEENNSLAKTYKGLKEVRDWFKL
jgi:hypothetical protein